MFSRVHIKVDEKINMTCGKDGGVQNLEVLGVLSVRIGSEDDGKIRILVKNNDNRNLQIQVHFFTYICIYIQKNEKKTAYNLIQLVSVIISD